MLSALGGYQNGPKSYHVLSYGTYGSLLSAHQKFDSYDENLMKKSPLEFRESKSWTIKLTFYNVNDYTIVSKIWKSEWKFRI